LITLGPSVVLVVINVCSPALDEDRAMLAHEPPDRINHLLLVVAFWIWTLGITGWSLVAVLIGTYPWAIALGAWLVPFVWMGRIRLARERKDR
jgi:cytochrome b subunit of formate dehydrogenase